MALTDLQIRKAAPATRKVKLSDGNRLALEIYPNGVKRWVMRYQFGGRARELALGNYPAVALADARKARDKANGVLAEGYDPGAKLRETKRAAVRSSENTFGAVLAAWVETYNPDAGQRAEQLAGFAEKGMSEKKVAKRREGWRRTYKKKLGQVKHLKALERIPFADVTARELLTACQAVEAQGMSVTAHELRSSLNSLYRYAVLECIITAKENPTDALKGGLLPKETGGRAAVIDQAELGKLLRDVAGYQGSFRTRAAMELGLLTFVRPGELRFMEWSEVDFEGKRWIIPDHRMKRDVEHLVPLSRQALEILRGLREAHDMMRLTSPYVFAGRSNPNKPMSENTVNTALRALGWPGEAICGHGFRASASTTLAQVLKQDERWIERQLSHAEKNKVKAAYNRAQFWPERVAMMQDWSDWLDHLRSGAPAIPLRQAAE